MRKSTYKSIFSNKKIKEFIDQEPLRINYYNSDHVFMFRRILEWSMHQGRWSGKVAMLS
jgi:hypothetical protein